MFFWVFLWGLGLEFAVDNIEEQVASIGVPMSLAKSVRSAGISLCAKHWGNDAPVVTDVPIEWSAGFHSGDPVLSAWMRSRSYTEVMRKLRNLKPDLTSMCRGCLCKSSTCSFWMFCPYY